MIADEVKNVSEDLDSGEQQCADPEIRHFIALLVKDDTLLNPWLLVHRESMDFSGS